MSRIFGAVIFGALTFGPGILPRVGWPRLRDAGPSFRSFVLTLVAISTFLPITGQAQSNDEINAGTEFNFSTPGARSLALGGAFLAMADDATAAFSNPAGLSQLWEGGSEVALEYRRWNYKSRFADRGHEFGDPTGIGVDTISGIREGESSTSVSGLSFLSVSVPASRWGFAAFRHEMANFESQFDTQGPFTGPRNRISPTSSRIDLKITNIGLAVARQIGTRLSLGADVYQSHFELESETARFWVNPSTGDPALDRLGGGVLGPPDRLPDNVQNFQRQVGDDESMGWSVGFLWRLTPDPGLELITQGAEESVDASPHIWRIGGVYRRSPAYDFQANYVFGPRAPLRRAEDVPGELRSDVGGAGRFSVPDVFGLGAAFVSGSGNWAISFDVNHVEYSALSDDIVNLVTVAGTGPDFRPEQFRIDDGTQFHVGTEYTLARYETNLVANVRLGAWYDPAHRLQYLGNERRLSVRFLDGEDTLHVSGGLGLTFQESFQADIGFDHSEKGTTLALSLVRFW